MPDTADTPAGTAQGTYGVSGLRSTESGSNYYNSLKITQGVTNGSASNVKLIGAAFTSKTSAPANNTLSELMRSSNYNSTETNGFVLVYAQQNTTYSGGPTPGTGDTGSNKSGCSTYNFCQGKYYVYFKGNWALGNSINQAVNLTSQGLYVNMRTTPTYPTGPIFSQVRLLKPIGTHTWGTYGYLMNSNNVETAQAINPPTPTPSPTPTPGGARIF